MTRRPEAERLVLEDLADEERDALLAGVDAGDAAAVERLATALAALDADGWEAAETPALRFVPEGAGEAVPFWSRMCVRSDAGDHRVAAPYVALVLVAAIVLAFGAGFALRGSGDDGAPLDDRLGQAPAVSLTRMASAPLDASGVARMVGGRGGRGGRVELRAHGLRPTGPGRWYELWMLRDDRHMVSVGTFRVRGDGTVEARFEVGVDLSRSPTMDVSIQSKADGAAHSGRSVLRSQPAT
ncbi:anti-sigma factor [Patulibacter sp. NPDC049589]|uniref:anti-sigma factor n=1 Tax=Patulibacter sp. NPDC049589 TaxID=3154731 RepID=UPI003421DFAA